METTPKPNVATMTAAELQKHIGECVQKHRIHVRCLRALWRVRLTEEDAK